MITENDYLHDIIEIRDGKPFRFIVQDTQWWDAMIIWVGLLNTIGHTTEKILVCKGVYMEKLIPSRQGIPPQRVPIAGFVKGEIKPIDELMKI